MSSIISLSQACYSEIIDVIMRYFFFSCDKIKNDKVFYFSAMLFQACQRKGNFNGGLTHLEIVQMSLITDNIQISDDIWGEASLAIFSCADGWSSGILRLLSVSSVTRWCHQSVYMVIEWCMRGAGQKDCVSLQHIPNSSHIVVWLRTLHRFLTCWLFHLNQESVFFPTSGRSRYRYPNLVP